MPPATLTSRLLEIQRRCEALPNEIKAWSELTLNDKTQNSHHSQVKAIRIMMDVFIENQKSLLAKLYASHGNTATFQSNLKSLILEIIKSQRVWDYFRSKLDQHRSPDFQRPLAIADTVAWDCYSSTLNNAYQFGIVPRHRFREPPLSYLNAEFSPATWVRGSSPNDGNKSFLEDHVLPIPVIEIPWDHVVNLWEYLSLHHEVGHELEADLGLESVLRNSLQARLEGEGVPSDRVRLWVEWEQEIFADIVGQLLGGSAFVYFMSNLLLFPQHEVVTYAEDDPHPTHYIRILMNAAFNRLLVPGSTSLNDDAKQLEESWISLYGDVPKIGDHSVTDLKDDFQIIFDALAKTKFAKLKNHTVADLIPFTGLDDAKIRAAAKFLAGTGSMPASIQPRYVICASRFALEDLVSEQGEGLATKIDQLNDLTAYLVKVNTPPGLRAAEDSADHRQFIEELTRAL